MTVLPHPTATRLRTDDELVAHLRSGHAETFEAIVDRYAAPLEAYARGIMAGAHHDAEEAVQDTLLRALAAIRRDDRRIVLRPWLYTICRNACLDRLRRPHRTVELALVAPYLADTSEDPHEALVRREELASLAERVRELPERQRTALLAVAVDGETHEQVARELAVSVAASKALVCRARQRLAAAA